MKSQSFRDIVVWQKSHTFCVSVYSSFKSCNDYSFRDQIQRASVSIMNNIAEGHSKRSEKSFRNFLLISKGSAAEVESMLELGNSLGYIDQATASDPITKADEISRMISGLVKSLEAHNS